MILLLSLLSILWTFSYAANTPTLPKLNTDNLPGLEEILTELSLGSRLKDFVKNGISETRYLLRMTRMDFHLMEIDWGLEKSEINALKDKITELIAIATVKEEPVLQRNKERDSLRYGRIYIPDAVQSFEFLLASFGGIPALGPQTLCLAPNGDGCEIPTGLDTNFTNCLYIVRRGSCSFLQKAQNAKIMNTSGIIIINNEDRLEALSSGVGVLPNITEDDIKPLKDFPVLSTPNITMSKLVFSLLAAPNNRLNAYTVPLKCGTGGRCEAVTPDEKALPMEVSWGRMTVWAGERAETFDFMTSTFGGVLTRERVCVVAAAPEDGCSGVEVDLAGRECPHGFALVAQRGVCSFDAKALVAETAEARFLVVLDKGEDALQRIGGQEPLMGRVGIPSVIVTSAAGKVIKDWLASGQEVTMELQPSAESVVSDIWIELAYTEWAQGEEQLLVQINSLIHKYRSLKIDLGGESEIIKWLERKKYVLLKRREDGEYNDQQPDL